LTLDVVGATLQRFDEGSSCSDSWLRSCSGIDFEPSLSLSEPSKQGDELDDEDPESDEEVGLSIAPLSRASRASRSFLEGFEMRPIAVHNGDRLSNCVIYKNLLSGKFAF